MSIKRSQSGLSLQEKATVTKFSDNLRRLTPLELQCQLFCGGKRCKYEGSSSWTQNQMALDGFYSHWITNKILAMARPNSEQMEKYDLINQFQSQGILTIINLQQAGEHCYCGPPLNESGFSYSPSVLMENGIYFYNYGWKDYSVASLSSITDTVKVILFSLEQGKVAIHCHAGLGRTGVLIACYLVFAYRISANAAIRFVRWKRPNSIQTRAQVLCVFQFADYILPKFSVFAQRNSAYPEFTLSEYQHRQSVVLHGYESRSLRYLPKIIHEVCDRMLRLSLCQPVATVDNANEDPYPQSFWAYFLCMQKDSKLLSNLASPTPTLNSSTSATNFEFDSRKDSATRNATEDGCSRDDVSAMEESSNVKEVVKGSPSEDSQAEVDISSVDISAPTPTKSNSDDHVVGVGKSDLRITEEKATRPSRMNRAYTDIGDRIVFPARVVSCSSVLLCPDVSPSEEEPMPEFDSCNIEKGKEENAENGGKNGAKYVRGASEFAETEADLSVDCFTQDLLLEENLREDVVVQQVRDLHSDCVVIVSPRKIRSDTAAVVHCRFCNKHNDSRMTSSMLKSHSCVEMSPSRKALSKSDIASRKMLSDDSAMEEADFLVRRMAGRIDLHAANDQAETPAKIPNEIDETESCETFSQMILQDEYVDLSLLEKLFNRTSSLLASGSSPTNSRITADHVVESLLRDWTDLPESVMKIMEELKDQLNSSHEGWDILRSTSDLSVLSGLLYSWLMCLKNPIITKEQLIRMSVSIEDPITQLHTLDRSSRVIVEYLARFIIHLQPVSEERKRELFSKLFHCFCHYQPDDKQSTETEADYPISNIVTKFAHNLLDLYLKEI